MATATTAQAIEIIKMQSYGAPAKHINDMLVRENVDTVIAYHVTKLNNMEAIKADGIKASQCYSRQAAVYMFLDIDDANSNAANITGSDENAIVAVVIPASIAAGLKDDGLYNGTFANSYSASRLEIDTIPTTWIS
jgi:hypothetical protein